MFQTNIRSFSIKHYNVFGIKYLVIQLKPLNIYIKNTVFLRILQFLFSLKTHIIEVV